MRRGGPSSDEAFTKELLHAPASLACLACCGLGLRCVHVRIDLDAYAPTDLEHRAYRRVFELWRLIERRLVERGLLQWRIVERRLLERGIVERRIVERWLEQRQHRDVHRAERFGDAGRSHVEREGQAV